MPVEFTVVRGSPERVSADLLVVPCYAGPEPGPGAAAVAHALGVELTGTLARAGFAGEPGDTFSTLSLGRASAGTVLFVGVGDRAAAGPDVIRRAAMLAAPVIAAFPVAATTLPLAGPAALTGSAGAAAAAFTEGLLLGCYRYGRYKHAPVDPEALGPRRLERVLVVLAEDGGGDSAAVAAGMGRGQLQARLANWARDLVNAPPGDTTPAALAAEARQLAADYGLDFAMLSAGGLADGGFGGILGVGRGSANEPVLVELSYRGRPGSPLIGLTGKGITFDSGGLTLKRTSEIEWMKSDMAGAAAVLAALRGAAELGLPVNIDAVLPFAENMPSGSAQRPGDVLTHRGGLTSEVADTDCEGRLVVADALAYLAERRPAVLADVATLTDAAGLGEGLWAVMGSDEDLVAELVTAGEQAGDPGWPLPLPAAYRRHLRSPVADLRNCPAEVPDSTLLAGAYLREFTTGLPWAHIDNGSTAYLERAGDGWPEGATGSPARALLRWLERRADHGSS